jgi:hypothetical protein
VVGWLVETEVFSAAARGERYRGFKEIDGVIRYKKEFVD